MKKIFKFIIQHYLRIITKITLWRHKPMVIAVAGTTNKTFVKEAILDELGSGDDIRGNPKSFNTEIGLPLAVLFLPSGYSSIFRWVDVLMTGTSISIFSRKFPKILVLEMGVDRKGDMNYLLSMVKPEIAVVTNIDRSFPNNNTKMDDIANELKELVAKIPSKGTVILNKEDERVEKLGKIAKSKVVYYGTGKECDVRIKDVEDVSSGQKFLLQFDEEDGEKVEIDRYGKHNIESFAIAKIVARELEKKKK